ncbi:MAG TPA: hypothetical protein VG205_07380 [Acidimicrobiales bacterium]|nr:hypothetical protein [Acidimicrobiales bacterium]
MPPISHQTMGWLRMAVGAALIVAPQVPMRFSGREEPTGASILLMRTIGVRDLVLGLGTVTAARSRVGGDGGDGGGAVRRWTTMAMASDSIDTVVSLASFRSIGKRDSVAAAVLAFVFACGDVVALREGPGATR